MRKPLIAGNWKMNNGLKESVALAEQLKHGLKNVEGIDIVVAPISIVIGRIADLLNDSPVAVAAQNCYPKQSGAFTGELSPALLKSVDCEYVIVGHSERRELFGEADEFINLKIKALLAEDLVPIFCIGETLTEREEGQMFDVLKRQVEVGLNGISAEAVADIVIAYEPVWAIGTGKTATSSQANDAHMFVRNLIIDMFGQTVADSVRILYGGSVKPESIDELMSQEHVDGALVGGASLKADDFIRIVQFQKS